MMSVGRWVYPVGIGEVRTQLVLYELPNVSPEVNEMPAVIGLQELQSWEACLRCEMTPPMIAVFGRSDQPFPL